MKSILAAALVAACSFNACATQLAGSPPAALWIQPSAQGAAMTQIAGDRSVPPAALTWNIAQWQIPTDLTGAQTVAPNTDWNIANAYARVGYTAANKGYELGQNGAAALPACGTEFDLFLGPNSQPRASYPQGITPSAPLSTLSSVKLSFGYHTKYEKISTKCALNYGATLVSLILSDGHVSPNQTLFYQFIIYDTRGGAYGAGEYRQWCPGFTGSTYCVDTSVAHFGMPIPAVGGARYAYNFDVAAELKSLIQAGHLTMDKDISHWNITSLYWGNLLQGGVTQTSDWDSFALTVTP